MVKIPNSVESVKLIGQWTTIPDELFSQLRELKKLTLPESVVRIGSEAFEYCEALEEIYIPDTVMAIGNSAFSNCKRMRNVKLPAQLKCIKESLFNHCSSLEAVSIPLGVTNIERYAFYDCPSLKKISIPDSVAIIADNAFDKICRIEKSESRLRADELAYIRDAKKSFDKSCEASDGEVHVNYKGVQYGIIKNIHGNENFIIAINTTYSSDLAAAFLIFPTSDLRDKWYAAVEECVDKIKNWVRVAAKNKVKQVSKSIPISTSGVCAYLNGITRGKGQQELFRKGIREPIASDSLLNLPAVNFIGTIKALDDNFTRYRVSIKMRCGDYFDAEIFYCSGNKVEIAKNMIEFLIFVNPDSFEDARKKQVRKEDLFN
jgi:hypothetical protein